MNKVDEAARIRRLEASLVRRLGSPQIKVTPFRSGVDSWVDKITRPGQTPSIVRSAKIERRQTRYDGLVDFGAELDRQILTSRLLAEASVPTPEVLAWHRTADPELEPSWMVLNFVEHDDWPSWADALQRELGTITRRIHAIEPPTDLLAVFLPSSPWSPWIMQRIMMRVKAAERYMPVADLSALGCALGSVTRRREAEACSLLHLDLRPANIAVRGGHIVSVFDLANAIVGDPWLELARIRGCGLLSSAFLEGYGADMLGDPSFEAALDVYELDLTALLVVVSREEFDDPALHTAMSERTSELLNRIITGSPS